MKEPELIQIISNTQPWLLFNHEKPVSIWKSDAVQAILFALEEECKKRIDVIETPIQWKLAVLFCKTLKLCRSIQSRENKSEFLAQVYSRKLASIMKSDYYISEMEYGEFVLFMCISSVLNSHQNIQGNLHERLQMKIRTLFEDMDTNELAICYVGMKKSNSPNIQELEVAIASKYGFRF